MQLPFWYLLIIGWETDIDLGMSFVSTSLWLDVSNLLLIFTLNTSSSPNAI